ncbi:hypothetical protein ACFLT1_10030, partial [Bacteroidota bacterium]
CENCICMEDRLLKLLGSEQLTPSKFADIIGVQRSSVSGRNKPSYDFIQKTLNGFPLLSAEWLLRGEGKMYELSENISPGSLFDQPIKDSTLSDKSADISAREVTDKGSETGDYSDKQLDLEDISQSEEEKEGTIKDKTKPERKLEAVVLLYSDNSFATFHPGE